MFLKWSIFIISEWRKLHYVELHNLGNADTIRMLKSCRLQWAGHIAWMEDGRRAHKLLLGKPEGKWPCGRPKIRWEVGYEGDGKTLAQTWQTYVLAAMNLWVP